jgi:hypothetical protein
MRPPQPDWTVTSPSSLCLRARAVPARARSLTGPFLAGSLTRAYGPMPSLR